MEGFVPYDHQFSYWVVIWFLIYYNIGVFHNSFVTIVKRYGSPLLPLSIALLFNIFELIYFMNIKLDLLLFIKYSIMMTILKITPIYLLIRKGEQIHWMNDPIVFALIFSFYLFYLNLYNETIFTVYKKTEESILQGNNQTPMFYIMDKITKLAN